MCANGHYMAIMSDHVGPLLSHRLPLASAKAQPRGTVMEIGIAGDNMISQSYPMDPKPYFHTITTAGCTKFVGLARHVWQILKNVRRRVVVKINQMSGKLPAKKTQNVRRGSKSFCAACYRGLIFFPVAKLVGK